MKLSEEHSWGTECHQTIAPEHSIWYSADVSGDVTYHRYVSKTAISMAVNSLTIALAGRSAAQGEGETPQGKDCPSHYRRDPRSDLVEEGAHGQSCDLASI